MYYNILDTLNKKVEALQALLDCEELNEAVSESEISTSQQENLQYPLNRPLLTNITHTGTTSLQEPAPSQGLEWSARPDNVQKGTSCDNSSVVVFLGYTYPATSPNTVVHGFSNIRSRMFYLPYLCIQLSPKLCHKGKISRKEVTSAFRKCDRLSNMSWPRGKPTFCGFHYV